MHTLCNYSSSLPSHVKARCLAFYMRPYTYLSSTLHDLASVWQSTLSSLLSRFFFSLSLGAYPLLSLYLFLDSLLFYPPCSLSPSLCLALAHPFSFSLPLSLSFSRALRLSPFPARLLSHVPVFHQRQPINKTPSSKNTVHFPRRRLAATLAP